MLKFNKKKWLHLKQGLKVVLFYTSRYLFFYDQRAERPFLWRQAEKIIVV